MNEPRYWVNKPPGPDAPNGMSAALVDEETGGEIAYFLDGEIANEVCHVMNNYEANN